MLVTRRRCVGDTNGPAWLLGFARVAQDEAPPDVEVPVEAKPLVQRPASVGVSTAECE